MSKIVIEYGKSFFTVEVPQLIDVAGMNGKTDILERGQAYTQAFESPLKGPSLLEIAKRKKKNNSKAKAIIVVSDNTRPVPYRGENGILANLLPYLLKAGFSEHDISILIGAGSHRKMSDEEKERMLGLKDSGYQYVRVLDHNFDKEEDLVNLGKTNRNTTIKINKHYWTSDLKIVTGLVESHFMAGASGGPKGICPGIVGRQTLETFHGPFLLQSDKACDLQIEGNPVQEEALAVAKKAGCDFLVNVTLDGDKNLTGVFCGELESAHKMAVEHIKTYVTVRIKKRYNIILIPAGFVGINHYQAAKAAVIAAKAVEKNGVIIIVARNTDVDPVGGESYKKALKILKETGSKLYVEKIMDPDWRFLHEQWQVQMWCKAIEAVGSEDQLIYCSTEIPLDAYQSIPGFAGLNLLSECEPLSIETITRRALELAIKNQQSKGFSEPSILFLKDGPYAVPLLEDDLK